MPSMGSTIGAAPIVMPTATGITTGNNGTRAKQPKSSFPQSGPKTLPAGANKASVTDLSRRIRISRTCSRGMDGSEEETVTPIGLKLSSTPL